MPAIHHIPVHISHITPEAKEVLDLCEIHREPTIPEQPGLYTYDFLVRAPDVGGVIRHQANIPVESGVWESFYQLTETEVIIVTREQCHPRDDIHYSMRLFSGTPEQINLLFEYPI